MVSPHVRIQRFGYLPTTQGSQWVWSISQPIGHCQIRWNYFSGVLDFNGPESFPEYFNTYMRSEPGRKLYQKIWRKEGEKRNRIMTPEFIAEVDEADKDLPPERNTFFIFENDGGPRATMGIFDGTKPVEKSDIDLERHLIEIERRFPGLQLKGRHENLPIVQLTRGAKEQGQGDITVPLMFGFASELLKFKGLKNGLAYIHTTNGVESVLGLLTKREKEIFVQEYGPATLGKKQVILYVTFENLFKYFPPPFIQNSYEGKVLEILTFMGLQILR